MSSSLATGGRLRRAMHRLGADISTLHAEEVQHEAEICGGTPTSSCTAGSSVVVAGVLRSVSLRPRAGVRALEAELYDGHGAVTLVWLGRREIAGIAPGRSIVARGRLAESDGRMVLYNPRYELRAAGARR